MTERPLGLVDGFLLADGLTDFDPAWENRGEGEDVAPPTEGL